MPKKPIDYSNTIIYEIVCKDLNITDCYVGHTTEFVKRKYKHKYSCNTSSHHTHNYNVYKFIRDNGGWDNWSMIEIEKYECIDSNEACSRERYWLETLKASLNTVIPLRTQKEYHNDNKVELNIKNKEKRMNNIEVYKEKEKIFRETNKDKIRKYREEHRAITNEKQRQKRIEIKTNKLCENII